MNRRTTDPVFKAQAQEFNRRHPGTARRNGNVWLVVLIVWLVAVFVVAAFTL